MAAKLGYFGRNLTVKYGQRRGWDWLPSAVGFAPGDELF
jgi:hypothetical protein